MVGITYATKNCQCLSQDQTRRGRQRQENLTEAVEHVEKGNEQHSQDVDGHPKFAQVEGALGEILPPRQDVGREGNGIGRCGENDE